LLLLLLLLLLLSVAADAVSQRMQRNTIGEAGSRITLP